MTKRMWLFIEMVIRFIIKKILQVTNKEVPEDLYKSIIQFLKFGIVGISNTIIAYLIYVLSLVLIRRIMGQSTFDYVFAQTIAFILSVLWSFYWNNKFVFVGKSNQKRIWWKSLIKTYITYSFTGLFLNNILIILWVNLGGISEFVAPILNLLMSVPLNFILNKYWAFR